MNEEYLTDEKWFLLQTNWDRQTVEPLKDIRRTVGSLRILANG